MFTEEVTYYSLNQDVFSLIHLLAYSHSDALSAVSTEVKATGSHMKCAFTLNKITYFSGC